VTDDTLLCWICQQPIPGEPRRYSDEPVHGACHPDSPGDGYLVIDGGAEDSNAHARAVAAQIRQAKRNDNLPDGGEGE
jgi:hypothetical protein